MNSREPNERSNAAPLVGSSTCSESPANYAEVMKLGTRRVLSVFVTLSFPVSTTRLIPRTCHYRSLLGRRVQLEKI